MIFEQAVEIILQHEAGYVWNPDDPGGETNFGISKRAYPDVDVRNLTVDQAIAIYRRDYWDELKIDKLPGYIRLVFFDAAVNQGRTKAVKMLQGALGVKQDGVFGPISFLAIQGTPAKAVFDNFVKLRIRAYQVLPHWERFGKGWSRRLIEIVLDSTEEGPANG